MECWAFIGDQRRPMLDRDGDFEATDHDDVLVTFCTGVISLAGQPLVTPTKG